MLLDINPGLIIWTIVTFLLLLVLLKKVAWGPILTALNQREENITLALNEAKKAQEDSTNILAEQKKLLKNADQEAQKIVQQARELAETLQNEIKQKANEEASRMLENAKREIGRERDAAINQLRKEVVHLAIEAASKLIAAELDAKNHQELIDSILVDFSSDDSPN